MGTRRRIKGQGPPEKAEAGRSLEWAEVRQWIDELQREWEERRKTTQSQTESKPYRLPEDSVAE